MLSIEIPGTVSVMFIVAIVVVGYIGKMILEYVVLALLDGLAKAIHPKQDQDMPITRAEHVLCLERRQVNSQHAEDQLEALSNEVGSVKKEVSGVKKILVAYITKDGKPLSLKDLKDLGVM